jgi:peptidoglycan hydrolase-like protein with peptidoglycan-binding domain
MPTKPVYKFEVDLKYGQTSTDIANLQDVLQREGLFPVNVDKTGLYGSVTAKAVLGFQTKYNLGTVEELTALAGKLVGPKTRAKLNELYAQ